MTLREGGNKELYDAAQAYRRRNHLPSMRQAAIAIMKEAGYTKADLFYDYLTDKRRPKGDKRPVFAQILRRPSDKLWPAKEV